MLNYGTVEQIESIDQNNGKYVEFVWKIPEFWQIVTTEQELALSSRFYISEPGYRLQIILTPNTTYSDNLGYVGTFFRLVTGLYDSEIEWPYKLKTVLTIVNHKSNATETPGRNSNGIGSTTIDYLKLSDGQPFAVIPNTDSCRLRSAFLRPSADQDYNPNPDGCGNRRHIALNVLEDKSDEYIIDGALWVKLTIYMSEYGTAYKTAELSMKYNQLVSYYEWTINDYMSIQNQSLTDQKIAVLTSEPFYTYKNGYLIQIFLTLLPKRNAFALSLALAQGDYDRYLQWPFPYKFELSIVDQSPGYWKRDYSVSMHPSTSECGTDPFFQPASYPEFCFLTVQSMELLTLTHYNFVVNNSLKIGFLTKLSSFSERKQTSMVIRDDKLVAEYNWLIPAISGKLDKYDLIKDKSKTLASEEFYTNGQGYLCQILLTINRTANNDFAIGLELALIEGQYDSILDWPFNKTFELSFVRQSRDNSFVDNITNNNNFTDSTIKHQEFKQVVIPEKSQCSRHSFQKPIERNPPCGHISHIPFSRLSRAQDLLSSGNLLVRVVIQL
ncbi:uncharacterized protein LOC128964031 [Oppia nitens]|uniref:uncharacterized protein LOC128964031 n=1 Tax=Oppia nitens TaxID=1686743 RepID=UPI0023DB5573|nr:uncharacterized protein LOC128964031 [Oppia nitens]